MKCWQYSIVSLNNMMDMNSRGRNGWEAVGISGNNVLLKREIPGRDTMHDRKRIESEGQTW